MKTMIPLACAVCLATAAFAGGAGKGKGKGLSRSEPTTGSASRGWTNGRPPGWSQGEKAGWKTNLPPGLAKKDSNHPALRKFLGDLDTNASSLQQAAEAKKLPKPRIEQLLESFQISSRLGVAPSVARAALAALLEFDGTEEEIEWTAKGLTYSVDKGASLDDVGAFVKNKLSSKLRGAELVSSLYDEIDKRAVKK